MSQSLYDAIWNGANKQSRQSLIKYLVRAEIYTWKHFDRPHLTRFANDVKDNLAESTAHTLFACLKSLLSKYDYEVDLPRGWRKILQQKNVRPMKTYLTAKEVEAFGNAFVESDRERTVRDGFYVSCKTGLRHSDLMKLTPSNFSARQDGRGYTLNYVSKKTKIQATVPCAQATKERVEWLHKKGVPVSLVYYNSKVRELARRAGIETEVTVFLAGKELSGPKWQFLSSHSARISFATVLADYGTNILDIMRLCGHKNTITTLGYIVSKDVKVNPKAAQYLTT